MPRPQHGRQPRCARLFAFSARAHTLNIRHNSGRERAPSRRNFGASKRQIGPLNVTGFGEFGHGPGPADLAFLQHVGTIGNDLRKPDILFG